MRHARLAALVFVLCACAGTGSDRPPWAPRVGTAPIPEEESAERLRPSGRIAHPAIDESSGFAYDGLGFWTHNDSGGEPVLYRSGSPDFTDAVALRVPGATNVDWEELAVLDGDLLVCDIGDNERVRDDLVIYRVRPSADGPSLELVAQYPVSYPDGRHDAEAVAAIGGKLHLVLKNRGEEAHFVYRFDDLRDGEPNVPTRIGALDLPDGEQATAMDYDEASARLAVLTYSQITFFDGDDLLGPPARVVTLHARQCEALCFVGADALLFGNEQRDVYLVDRAITRPASFWLPEQPTMALKHVRRTTGAAKAALPPTELLGDVPLRNRRRGEFLRFGVSEDRFVLEGRFDVEGKLKPTPADASRPRTGLLLTFGTVPRLRITSAEPQFAIVADDVGRVRVMRMDISGGDGAAAGRAGLSWDGRASSKQFHFVVSLDVDAVFPDGLPETFLFDAVGNGFRKGDDEPVFAGYDFWSLFRPYAWGVVDARAAREP